MNKTSDYISYDKVLNKGLTLLKDNKKYTIGFYLIFSINTGLRISDVLQIKHKDLKSDKLILNEKKTKKERIITINNVVKKSYSKLVKQLNDNDVSFNDDDFIFVSQKGSVYKTQSINELLKKVFNSNKLQISSHLLRKSFGRRVFENNQESEKSLIFLSDIFNHSDVSITRRYLGIRKEEIENVYLNL